MNGSTSTLTMMALIKWNVVEVLLLHDVEKGRVSQTSFENFQDLLDELDEVMEQGEVGHSPEELNKLFTDLMYYAITSGKEYK